MFNNPIVGGIRLIRDAISSENFVSGVSGWIIRRDGTSEFASGTFRGPVVIIDPSTGAVLATVGADGSASFQSVETPVLTIDGVDIGAFLEQIGEGIVGQFRTTSTLPAPGTNSTFTNTCWTQFQYFTDRTYRVSCTAAGFQNTASLADSNLVAKVIFNQSGITGGAANETVHLNRISASGGETQTLRVDFYMSGATSRAVGASTITLQLSSDDGVTWAHADAGGTNVFAWTVEDIGPLITSAGGTGAPSGSLTWIVEYPAIASRSYDGNGNYIGAPDGDDNIYIATFADRSPYVNERFEVLWNGDAMRTDLAGATIIYARLWLYCFKAEEAKGSIGFGVTTDTVVQSDPFDDNDYIDQTWAIDDAWPVPGWFAFDMLSPSGGHTVISEFLTDGGNGIIARQPFPPGLAATGYRGYGTTAYRPYIEIKYVGNPPVDSGYGASGYGVGGYGE